MYSKIVYIKTLHSHVSLLGFMSPQWMRTTIQFFSCVDLWKVPFHI